MQRNTFWVVKGNRLRFPSKFDTRTGDLDECVEDGLYKWATKKPIPAQCTPGNGVFFWSSSPDCYVKYLGEIIDPLLGNDGKFNRFSIKYKISYPGLSQTATIRDLRNILPSGGDAAFLMPSDVRTIYPLSFEQAKSLANVIISNSVIKRINDRDNKALAAGVLHRWGLV